MQPGEQTTAQTSHQTSGGDPISQPLPPPPQTAQQLEEQEILRSLQAKAKEEGTDKDEGGFVSENNVHKHNVHKLTMYTQLYPSYNVTPRSSYVMVTVRPDTRIPTDGHSQL